MSKNKQYAGQTSNSLAIFIQDTSSTTGGGLSGVTNASSGLVMEYRRYGQSSWTSVSPVSKTLGTYVSGGIVADGSLAGAYEVDFPDAAFAAGARLVWLRVRGVANMLPVLIEIELDAVNYQTDAFGAVKPTVAGRTLDVSAGGEAGIDLANVGSPTTTLNLSGTTISTSQAVASVASRVTANTDQWNGVGVTGMPMPTYTQPTGFLLASFPASVANETTVASRASQTSVDAIPTNPLLTNDARLNYLDFSIATLNTNVLNLNNLSAKMNVFGAPLLEIPESGSTVYAFTLVVKDDEDKLVALDALPTVTAANAAGTNRSGNLSAVSNPATGRYTFTYTVANTHAAEPLRISISGAVSSEARYVEWVGAVVNYDSLTVLQSLQSTVNGINTKIPYTMNLDTSGRVLLQPIHHPGVSIDNVTVVDELGVNGLASNALDSDIARLVWNQLVSDNWDNNSFGKRGVISTNSTREIAITGSGHVASVLHSSEPNSIAETSFVSGAVSARVIAADAIDADAMAASANTEIANAVAALQTIVDIGVMITGTGTANAKWSTNALSLAPGGAGTGSGARTVTITANLSGAPVEGAKVRLTKAGESYLGTTDSSGQITFNVDDGSWIVGITSPNTTFAGAILAVSGNVTQSYSVTAMTITPSAPGGVTGYWTCLSQNGLPESGVTMSMQAVSFAEHASTGLALDTTVRTTTSDANGLAQFADLVPGVRYHAWRGSGAKVYVTIPVDADSTLELNSLLGTP